MVLYIFTNMNLIKIIFIFVFSNINVGAKRFIVNNVKPACKNCKYYIPYKFPVITEDSIKIAKCVKFGKKDLVTCKITYDHVDVCRNNENRCGENGKYFTPLKNLIRTSDYSSSRLPVTNLNEAP